MNTVRGRETLTLQRDPLFLLIAILWITIIRTVRRNVLIYVTINVMANVLAIEVTDVTIDVYMIAHLQMGSLCYVAGWTHLVIWQMDQVMQVHHVIENSVIVNGAINMISQNLMVELIPITPEEWYPKDLLARPRREGCVVVNYL